MALRPRLATGLPFRGRIYSYPMASNRKQAPSHTHTGGPADLTAPNRTDKPMAHNNLDYREHRPLTERNGLDDKGSTNHALCHTFATTLFVKGDHPMVVQSYSGRAP